MKLKDFLLNKRASLIKKWAKVIIETYPLGSHSFFVREKNVFANPVGNTITREVENLYDGLITDGDAEKITSSLDGIIRIRAVQDFEPSQAISFVLRLKDLIRKELGKAGADKGLSDELLQFEKKIDDTLLQAFDIYSQCRKQIYEIRVHEVKNHLGKLLERANLTCEIPE